MTAYVPHITTENAAELARRGGITRTIQSATDRLRRIPTGAPIKPEHLRTLRSELERLEAGQR